MEKISQEFYCHRCPDGGTYIMVKLAMGYDRRVAVVCPYCGARHERMVKKGVLKDTGKTDGQVEELCPPRSACSKTPRTVGMSPKKPDRYFSRPRGGVVVKNDSDLTAQAFLNERWTELYGGGS